MTSARFFLVLLYLCFAAVPAWSGEGEAIEGRILESQVMMRQGDFQQAREILEHAVAGAPGEPTLYLHLGNVYRELGWMGEAAAAYNKAVKIHPGFSGAFEAMAALYRHLEKWDEAIAAYQQLAAIDPSAARPYFEMAMIYRNQGFGEQGKKALLQAYRLNPQFVMQAARLQQVELDELSLLRAGDAYEEQAGAGDEASGGTGSGFGPPAPGSVIGAGDARQAAATDHGQNGPDLPGEKAAQEWGGHSRSPAVLLLLAAVLLAWGGVRVWKGRK